MHRGSFIDALVADLRPVRRAPPISRALIAWTLLAWIVVGVLVLSAGPLRAGALDALRTSPRYAAEFLLGAASVFFAAWAGLEWGVPGDAGAVRRSTIVAALFAAWVAMLLLGIGDPAIATGMLGKRPHCRVETIAFALPALWLGLIAVRRRALYGRSMTGALLGLAAAAVPATWMQLACVYEPLHALSHHLAPIAWVAAIGLVVGRLWLPRLSPRAIGAL